MRQIFGTLIVIGVLLASNSRSTLAQYAPSGPIVLNGDPVAASPLPPSNYAGSNFLNRSLTPGSWSRIHNGSHTGFRPQLRLPIFSLWPLHPVYLLVDWRLSRDTSAVRSIRKKLRTIETISLHCLVESSTIGDIHPDRWRKR